MRTPEFFPLYFVVVWFGVTFLLSRLGWVRLAGEFAFSGRFEGTWLGFVSGRINGITYRNAVSLRYNKEGVYIRPVLFFRMFHKSLLIPWHRVEITELKFPFGRIRHELSISGTASVSLFLSHSQAEQLKQYTDPATR